MTDAERNQRIVALVTAKGSVVKPSALNMGMVVVVDGRTGKDACCHSADDAFDALFREEDEGEELPRLGFGFTDEGAPTLVVTP